MSLNLSTHFANTNVVSHDLPATDDGTLSLLYQVVRKTTEKLCENLVEEDYMLQSMPEASPAKWHLAHTTWFFETFLLLPYLPNYRPYNSAFTHLFNSYYEAVGPRWPRSQRDLLSRPTIGEVFRYRAFIDEHMARLFREPSSQESQAIASVALLGIQHEQQHQELLITDLKHAWSVNPLRPIYGSARNEMCEAPPQKWISHQEGLCWIGHAGEGFAFDNERPRHRVYLQDWQLSNRLVTNGEYLQFILDKGYERPELWLSDGWAARFNEGWSSPLYWEQSDNSWSNITLSGHRPLDLAEPVCHISYYEADAFARWAGARLPTEAEWEVGAAEILLAGHFQESGRFHPSAALAQDDRGTLFQLDGDVWQWTASPYIAYPGYQTLPGALGEYNGKFMCNQFVLRGSSCATPRTHARRTYRNFFPPNARWQFTGIRLAKDSTPAVSKY